MKGLLAQRAAHENINTRFAKIVAERKPEQAKADPTSNSENLTSKAPKAFIKANKIKSQTLLKRQLGNKSVRRTGRLTPTTCIAVHFPKTFTLALGTKFYSPPNLRIRSFHVLEAWMGTFKSKDGQSDRLVR